MKVVVWYIQPSKTLRCVLASDVQIIKKHGLDFVKFSSVILGSARIHKSRDVENVLTDLYLQGVGEIALLREHAIDRVAFVNQDSELGSLIKAVPELKSVIGLARKAKGSALLKVHESHSSI